MGIGRMKEIKFRAWDRLNKRFIYLFFSYPVGQIQDLIDMSRMKDYSGYMQYTGLKDKNGKEIYEGDILKIPIGEGGYVPVTFEDGKFIAYNQYDFLREFEQEVVGNIYGNPELLK